MQQEFAQLNRTLDVAKQLGSPLIRTFLLGHISSYKASPEQLTATNHDKPQYVRLGQ